jgi:nicotinate-nucleotide pyrophosphorylase (carboxylating)
MLDSKLIDNLIELAIEEDIGHGDITSYAIDDGSESVFKFISKEVFILCGISLVEKVFKYIDKDIEVVFTQKDGDFTVPDNVFGIVKGRTYSILKGERTALNFLQRLSGIATNTYRYVNELKDSKIKLLDTRKTTPGHRFIQKYAVKIGGGNNHRFGLYDGVMIKDNHVDAAGGITNAIEKVRNHIPSTIKIEVEARNLQEVKEAVENGADIIMLDNFEIDDIKKACEIVNKKAKLEISGGVTLDNISNYAHLDVDYISVGALTHQALSVDISLKYGGKL